MKELKKALDKMTNSVYKFLERLSDIIKKDEHSFIIKAIIKLIILVLIYFVLGIIAEGLVKFGTYIIYHFGTSARYLLSVIWSSVVNFVYFLFIIVSFYQLTEIAEEDNSFFVLYKNKRKDREMKQKIFVTIDNVIAILKIIILIPLFIIDISLLYSLGIMVGYLNQGIYLISLFLAVIGLLIFFTTAIFIVKVLLSPKTENLRKYLYMIIFSGLLVAISSVTIILETSNYDTNQDLTTDFTTSKITYEYKINSNKNYIINNNGQDTNLELVIDDDLGSYLEIIIMHATTNEVTTKLSEKDNKVNISYNEELNLNFSDLEKLYNLGLTCIKEKTIYNYTLLKYAKIEVRVSSDYAENIKFIDDKGKEYVPYEELDK